MCVGKKAVLTGLRCALGKVPDSGFICCCCGLCMLFRSVIISGVRERERNRRIDSRTVIF